MKTSKKIIEYTKKRQKVSANELAGYLQISNRAVFKQLRNLLEKGEIEKTGSPPKVYYFISSKDSKISAPNLGNGLKKYINEHYLLINPYGQIKPGFEGFAQWCQKHNLPVEKTAKEYKETLDKYLKHKRGGFINGALKMKSTFNEVNIDQVYYLDFYSIERFGKTKLGQKLLYAKQSQNAKLIKGLSEEINPKINKLIKKKNIEAIGFIPPTVKREVQLIKEIRKNLNPVLPVLDIVKIKTEIAVPQKTLNKLDDRIENARRTFAVDDKRSFKTVLLVDDAVGSGATLNETSRIIKQKGIAKKVIGLAITGSYKGFDVISEV